MMATKCCRAQGSAAGLVILLVILAGIVAYALMVPEEELRKLGVPPGAEKTLLDVAPGRVAAVKETFRYFEHNLPIITIDNRPQPSTALLRVRQEIKRGLGIEQQAVLSFDIPDETLAKVQLEFVVESRLGNGNLDVHLNNQEIWFGPFNTGQKAQIELPLSTLLEGKNNLEISVSSPGWKFWQRNSYTLLNINLVTNRYESKIANITQSTIIGSSELSDIRDATFTAYVKQISESPSAVKISVNGNELFNALPPTSLVLDISPDFLKSGSNLINWYADRDGAYQVTFGRITIRSTRVPTKAVKYSFTVSEADWAALQNQIYVHCKLNMSRSSGGDLLTVKLNAYVIENAFSDGELTADVCKYLKQGVNSIVLTADKDIYLEQLKIVLES